MRDGKKLGAQGCGIQRCWRYREGKKYGGLYVLDCQLGQTRSRHMTRDARNTRPSPSVASRLVSDLCRHAGRHDKFSASEVSAQPPCSLRRVNVQLAAEDKVRGRLRIRIVI